MQRENQPEDEWKSPLPGFPGGTENSIPVEVGVPLIVAAIPAGLFALLGFIGGAIGQRGMKAPVGIVASIVVVETLGIIAMACVVLLRFEHGTRRLMRLTRGRPPGWRKLLLKVSIACLLMFDLLTNVSAAFPGAGFFLLSAAVPMFMAYLVFNRITFVGLRPMS